MNILRRNKTNPSPNANHPSVIRRLGVEPTMMALSRFTLERNLINISILEIEGGIVIQGITDAETEHGRTSFLQTHVLSEQDVRAIIERLEKSGMIFSKR